MIAYAPPAEYPVVSAGIDWLTCTAKNGSPALALERVSDIQVARERMNGTDVTHQTWLGFEGYKLDGLFFGRREHDVMLCLSGRLSNELGPLAIAASTNVSRLDLQVSLWTEGEAVNLAQDTWDHLKSATNGVGRPRSFSLIVGHPVGQTCYLNSRTSDNFGRIYDKGVESKIAPGGLLWRYEVEFKRQVAKQESAALGPQDQLSAYAISRVHRWMTKRHVFPPWATLGTGADADAGLPALDRDVLTWFDKSVRVSVGKAIKKYGLVVVLESLGLLDHMKSLGGKFDGNQRTTTDVVSSHTGAATAQPNNSERVLLH